MLSFLPGPLVGVIAGILFLINIVIVATLIIILGFLKFVLPFKILKHSIETVQYHLISMWIDLNTGIMRLATKITFDVHPQGQLQPNHWYFVFANHQSWADILILQEVFNRKIPMLKFFMKQELLWSLPMGGIACWILDFPVMKRPSKAKLRKNPQLRNKDIETTKLACAKFKKRPTTVINFLEGTRFTKEKQQDRSSPYENLLRPKAGGLAFVITELKDYIAEVIDVTIKYDYPEPSFWNMLCGKIKKVSVYYEVLPLNEEHYGDYYSNSKYRKEFQSWVNERWQQKNGLLVKLNSGSTE
jgi:1-acyl-sn-glycerol-3-phosphate acyltransferase